MWNDINQRQKQLINDIESIKNEQILTDEKPLDNLLHLLQLSDL